MTKFRIYPYKMQSAGAIALRNALDEEPDDALLIRRENSTYRPSDDHLIISWGTPAPFDNALNRRPEIAINKRDFYQRMQGIGIHALRSQHVVPPYVLDMDDARELTFPVLCRTRVEGADGQGIVIAETPDDLVPARLYVQLQDKIGEWRVHAGRLPNGEVTIFAVQMKRHTVTEGIDPRIWTGDSAFLTYNHDGAPECVHDVVRKAMEKLPELTFGGFDVIVLDPRTACVVEVNSAPMLTARTAEKYAQFFRDYVQMRDNPVVAGPPAPEPVAQESVDYEPTEDDIGSVFEDLNRERVSLRTVIAGYIRDCRRQ